MKMKVPVGGKESGIALVLVLGFLVLISALIISFFSSVQTDLESAKSYSHGTTVKQLAEMTTNVVQAQISDATRSFEVPKTTSTDPSGKQLTWATQPGLVRTYGDDGKPHRTFKLFSAQNMVVEGEDYIASERAVKTVGNQPPEIAENWVSRPTLYTDLNSPVLVPEANGPVKVGGREFRANFPVLDPFALSKIEGFALGQNDANGNRVEIPGYGAVPSVLSESTNPTVSADPRKTGNPAPMPVLWFYVLQDGTMTAPNVRESSEKEAKWGNAPAYLKPSRENPIVGRIAFWTDDETSKLNINTASEGVFWDRPWANSDSAGNPFSERQLARQIPAQNEYQRFPGHPATTSLSPVLGMISQFAVPAIPSAGTYSKFEAYYALAPRIASGGTRAGTVNNRVGADFKTVVTDQDRLYASVDELMFTPESQGGRREATPSISRSDLEKAKFFLTAYNRAPEVNLFGKPRIGLWPLQQSPDPNARNPGGTSKVRNAKDELLAYCSTIGTGSKAYKFYFERASVYLREQVNNRGQSGRVKGGNDLPIAFKQLPPAYQPPSSQLPTMDWVLPRNIELYKYLQRLTERPIPGFGKAFAKTRGDKYGFVSADQTSERDQILTQMIDLSRAGLNTYSTGLAPRYEYAPARDMPDASIGETQIVPLVPVSPGPGGTAPGQGTKGFGRFATVSEAALMFYRVLHKSSPTAPGVEKIRCMLILESVSPTSGPASWSPLVRYVVKGLQGISINGTSSLFPGPVLSNLVTSRVGYGSGSDHSTAFNGLYANFRRWAGSGSDANKYILNIDEVVAGTYDEELDYAFVSRGVDVVPGSSSFSFTSEGEIEVEVHAGYATAATPSTLVQKIRFAFPPNNFPLPKMEMENGKPKLVEEPGGAKRAPKGINTRIVSSIDPLVNTGHDVVRSVELDPATTHKGDIRLLAGRKDVPSSFFAPSQPDYDSQKPVVHSLRMGDAARWGGTNSGTLIVGSSDAVAPVAARGLTGAVIPVANNAPGDWDNGSGGMADGAYINKPDEGNAEEDLGSYYSSGFTTEKGKTFSPNRQVSSAVMFGSLPSRVIEGRPWETLLFCANPAAGRRHPGFLGPRDHLLLDLFTMPVVEPYAISEPFSTAGKVNLNYEIAPFTYITRTTALRGVFKATKVMAIPTSKSASGILRRTIDADETLKGFEKRFIAGSGTASYDGDKGTFRSASEICDMFLIPEGAKLDDMADGRHESWWWRNFRYTGDNAREIPYGQIYPRVTTKSNTFTIHMRVQTLVKAVPASNSTAAQVTDYFTKWVEDRDKVASEYRGSTTIERYIDPADPDLPDFTKDDPKATMDEHYKFRVVNTKRFAP